MVLSPNVSFHASLFPLSLFQPYGRAVDWWCLGAVLYEMLYGLPPFYSRNTSEMYERILNKPLTLRPGISESAKDLLSQVSPSWFISIHMLSRSIVSFGILFLFIATRKGS